MIFFVLFLLSSSLLKKKLSEVNVYLQVQELVSLGSMLAYLLEFPDRINPNYELKVWASQIACGKCKIYDKFYSLTCIKINFGNDILNCMGRLKSISENEGST